MSLNLQAVFDLAHSNDPIAPRVSEALSVIEEAINTYGKRRLSLSFNGGKDCTVLLHLYAAALHKLDLYPTENGEPSEIHAIYIPMPSPFHEMEAFIDESRHLYNLKIFEPGVMAGGMKTALDLYRKQCPEIDAILIGTRRTDPHGEKLSHRTPTDVDWPAYMRVHPIIDWDYADIWRFLRALDVKYCSLYDQGYTSLGSTYNTFPNPSLYKPPDENNINDGDTIPARYRPAYELEDGSLERCGRGIKAAD
ncbi:adenine nucleotide alpha hydrolases-like protein [Sistotremastrum niveocremeum HHB9708]|uniref:FAD synthase n=1 Tax=Sistotremastrum niveocremeum HHB9708 TaxID=1314777 RepID=A0A164NS12_9AGAM|nr:adenine nucleotide alpha hydrolases-like protein [Sistotremastrum niveocremeum HHB9708]